MLVIRGYILFHTPVASIPGKEDLVVPERADCTPEKVEKLATHPEEKGKKGLMSEVDKPFTAKAILQIFKRH